MLNNHVSSRQRARSCRKKCFSQTSTPSNTCGLIYTVYMPDCWCTVCLWRVNPDYKLQTL